MSSLTGHGHSSPFCQNGWDGRALLGQPSKGHPRKILILFSIIFYYISTTYQEIGDLFCPVIFLYFRTVQCDIHVPSNWFVAGWKDQVHQRFQRLSCPCRESRWETIPKRIEDMRSRPPRHKPDWPRQKLCPTFLVILAVGNLESEKNKYKKNTLWYVEHIDLCSSDLFHITTLTACTSL